MSRAELQDFALKQGIELKFDNKVLHIAGKSEDEEYAFADLMVDILKENKDLNIDTLRTGFWSI